MRLIDKIKKHGVRESLLIALAHFSNTINRAIYNVCKLFPICQNRIVLESEGDLSDNAYALYDYMYKEGYLKRYNVVWLVSSVPCSKQRVFENTCCFEKYPRHIAAKRSYYLATCRWYIYDHCNVMSDYKKKKGQQIVNLWHGCGVKATSYAKKESNADFLISTGKIFNKELSKILGIKEDKIYSLGYPRTDYFYKELSEKQLRLKNDLRRYKKTFLWMPTFRRSYNKNLDEKYFESYTGLPIITSENGLVEFNRFLKMNNSLCVFKIHHLQSQLPEFQSNFSNIKILDDQKIKQLGVQLYEYVMLTDALITDYSSIATDYMLLDKPILYTIDDYEEFSKSRGLCFEDPISYLPGYKVANIDEFYAAINNILRGEDCFKLSRNEINDLFNDFKDGNSSQRILQLLKIL